MLMQPKSRLRLYFKGHREYESIKTHITHTLPSLIGRAMSLYYIIRDLNIKAMGPCRNKTNYRHLVKQVPDPEKKYFSVHSTAEKNRGAGPTEC
jgi:hypothetical protein